MKFIQILFLTVLLLINCTDKTQKMAEPKWETQEGWNSINNEDYFVQFPEDWNIIIAPDTRTVFTITSPVDYETDSFVEHISLYKQRVKYKTNLNRFGAKSVENYQFMSKDFELHNRKYITDNGEYYRIDATTIIDGKEIRCLQYILLRKETIFALNFNCLPETYDSFTEIGEEIILSFIPKPNFYKDYYKPYMPPEEW